MHLDAILAVIALAATIGVGYTIYRFKIARLALQQPRSAADPVAELAELNQETASTMHRANQTLSQASSIIEKGVR